jgi:hypothetical protein
VQARCPLLLCATSTTSKRIELERVQWRVESRLGRLRAVAETEPFGDGLA